MERDYQADIIINAKFQDVFNDMEQSEIEDAIRFKVREAIKEMHAPDFFDFELEDVVNIKPIK